MTESMLLRRLEPADDPAMAAIIREVMTEHGAVGEGFSINDPEVDQMFAAYSVEGAAYFVLEVEGRVVGGAGVGPLPEADPDVCELKKMYVLDEGRGLGWGHALMVRCLEAAIELGYGRCYLETLGTMAAAQRLYRRHGFESIDAPMGATGHHGCNQWFLSEL